MHSVTSLSSLGLQIISSLCVDPVVSSSCSFGLRATVQEIAIGHSTYELVVAPPVMVKPVVPQRWSVLKRARGEHRLIVGHYSIYAFDLPYLPLLVPLRLPSAVELYFDPNLDRVCLYYIAIIYLELHLLCCDESFCFL